jgi:hypothetical protein
MTSTIDLISFATELRIFSNGGDTIAFCKKLQEGKRMKVSNRKLAGMAGCSATHVRNLLDLLTLPLSDQASISGGAPYRQFLEKVSKGKSASKKAAISAAKTASERAATNGAKAIKGWCILLDLCGGFAEGALRDAKGLILGAEADGTLKPSEIVWQGSPEEAFERNLPANYLELRGIEMINAACRCIARSAVRLMPNSNTRYHAICMAMEYPELRARW